MKPLLCKLLIPLAMTLPARAQITVERFFNTQQNITDYGQYLDVRNVTDLGIVSITDVNVGLVMRSATGDTMRLGDYFVSLTHGTASEEERVAVLLNRPRASDTRTWGSSLSSANFQFDDSIGALNIFGTTTTSGTFAADGRLSVSPYATAQAYDPSSVTHGLSALTGEILGSNTWSLLVADTRQGGVGFLDSWSLQITGNTAAGGRVDPGSGGIISDRPGTGGSDSPDNEVLADLVLSGSGEDRVTADVTGNLLLRGGLSGGGDLLKKGSGKLTLRGNSENFSGKLTVNAGEIEIGSSNALGPSGSLALEGDRVKLSLSGGSSLANPVTLGDAATAIFEGAGLISGTISGNGQFLKEGSGKIELTGNNFFAGQTTITGGILQIGNGGTSGRLSTSSAIVNNSNLTINRSDVVRQGTDFTSEAITGAGSFTAAGTGTTILSAANAYAGETKINAGADLRINGNQTGAGMVTVAANAKLGGSGSVISGISVSGEFAPGNSIESFGSGDLNFISGSTYAYELLTESLDGDLAYAGGTVDIAAGTILTLTDLATSTALANGSKLTLISSVGAWNLGLFSYDSGAGLSTLADDSDITLGENIWRINYNDLVAGSNFIADTAGATNFITLTVVPEPKTAALFGSLSILMLLYRRRIPRNFQD